MYNFYPDIGTAQAYKAEGKYDRKLFGIIKQQWRRNTFGKRRRRK